MDRVWKQRVGDAGATATHGADQAEVVGMGMGRGQQVHGLFRARHPTPSGPACNSQRVATVRLQSPFLFRCGARSYRPKVSP